MRCPNPKCESKTKETKPKPKPKTLDSYDVGPLFGLPSVIVQNIPALVCETCGDVLLSGNLVDFLSKQLVQKMLTDTYPLGGCEIRFLRKAMRLTQQTLAERLGVDRQAIMRWEDKPLEQVSVPNSIAIRTVLGAAEQSPLSSPPPRENFQHAPEPRPAKITLSAPEETAA